jgi:hypothetical protein
MSAPDALSIPVYELPCTECRQVSHKSLIQLITEDRLACDHCGNSIVVAREYGKPRLEEILISLGRRGFTIPEKKKFD